MNIISKAKKKIKNNIREHIPTEVLVDKGMIIGENFFRGKDVEIDYDFCWLIEIGNEVTIAPGCRILAHDASMRRFLGYTRIGTVEIGNKVFIGADSIILPGVKIGNNVIVGAGSVVSKDLEDGFVYAGIPAKKICKIDDYLIKHKEPEKIYIEKDTFKNEYLTDEYKLEIKREIKLSGRKGYCK